MRIYVTVNTYQACNEVEVRTLESKKDAQAYAARAYLNVDEYGKGKDVDAFKEKIEKAGYVNNLTADYTIYETELKGVKEEN